MKVVKGWYITKHEPTADQLAVVRACKDKVQAVSFDEFKTALIDTRNYYALRKNYPFGGSEEAAQYIPLDYVDESQSVRSLQFIDEGATSGERYVLLGDYGAGKSTTLRELYLRLFPRYFKDSKRRFPLLLNLRDHQGQKNPAEALLRHGTYIGMTDPSQLTRAWRAGLTDLILDGFDELAIAGWSSNTRRLRDIRWSAMELVRNFIRESPDHISVIVAGRAHYFDSREELHNALGTKGTFKVLDVSDFNDAQIAAYLDKHGIKTAVPDWLPSRPLLLGLLASKGILPTLTKQAAGLTKGDGWHLLLDMISEREAAIEVGIDPASVRQIIERLATYARIVMGGMGPLQPDQIIQAFEEVAQRQADDAAMLLLQRLPGLAPGNKQDGSRVFLDADFTDAARSGDVYRFIAYPYDVSASNSGWLNTMQDVGVDVCSRRCGEESIDPKLISVALERAAVVEGTLAIDVIAVLSRLGSPQTVAPTVSINDVLIDSLSLTSSSPDLSKVTLNECLIRDLALNEVSKDSMPLFNRCFITTVYGRVGEDDLPMDRFQECTFESFADNIVTNAAIMNLDMPMGRRVALTILRKVYLQAGGGRQETALYRGLDGQARPYVRPVLDILYRDGLLVRSAKAGFLTVWYPARQQRERVLHIINAPNQSTDMVLAQCDSVIT